MTFSLSLLFFIFFRLMNFCILVALVWHVFNKYFYHDLKAHVRRRLDWWLALRNNIMQLRLKQKELDVNMASEQWTAQRLLKNIDRWRSFVQQENKRVNREAHERTFKLQEVKKIQEHNYQQTLLKKTYTPAVFLKSTHALQTYYAINAHAQLFVDRSLQTIRKQS